MSSIIDYRSACYDGIVYNEGEVDDTNFRNTNLPLVKRLMSKRSSNKRVRSDKFLYIDYIAAKKKITVIGTFHLNNFDGVSDRAKRISQFVREDGKKIILLSVGFAQLLLPFFYVL